MCQCLEMLRAVKKDAGTLEMVLQEIRAARRGNKHFDSFADRLERELADSTQLEARARRLAELLALALQGSLLVRHAPPEVADAGLRFASGATPVSSSGRSPQTQISMS